MPPDPGLSLLVFGVVSLVLGVAFWPRSGLVPRLSRMRRESERVRLEDGLKHLLECERTGRACTLENLAGRLEVTRGDASDVLTRLAQRGLAESRVSGFGLTEDGRAYALRIVRTHRLWERYLADRTGVPPGEWHAEAERVEHVMTEEEADRLASRLGHPRYDPHGDPIPTATGEIPAPEGIPLTRVEEGRAVVVRHVEDEPPEVYSRLVAAGLAPGAAVEVVRAVDGRGEGGMVALRANGEEREIRAVDAANVTVEILPPGAGAPSGGRTLAEVAPGEWVRATGISPSCQGPQRRRLLDLGVVPGTVIVPELVSTSGDPVAYRVRGALIALRREQAAWIGVEPAAAEEAAPELEEAS